jgi:phage terminase small subunit
MNAQQRAFADEYLKDFNATQAALRAGYSEKTAYAQGHRLLKNAEISQHIEARLSDITMSANEVLQRLAEQARGEYGRYINEDGYVEVDKLVKDGKAHLIKAVKPGQWGTVYEFYDAQSALALIGKHHKLFTDKTEVSGPDGDVIRVTVKRADD